MPSLGDLTVDVQADTKRIPGEIKNALEKGLRSDFTRSSVNAGHKIGLGIQKGALPALIGLGGVAADSIGAITVGGAGAVGALLGVAGAASGAALAIAGIGVAGTLVSKQVRNDFWQVGQDLKKDLGTLTSSFVAPMEHVIAGVDQLAGSLTKTLKPVFDTLAPLFEQFASVILGEIPVLVAAFKPLLDAAGPILQAVLAGLAPLFDGINQTVTILAPVMVQLGTQVFPMLAATIGQLLPVLATLLASLAQAGMDALPAVLDTIVALVDGLAPFLTQLGQVGAQLLPALLSALLPIIPLFLTLADGLLQIATGIAPVLLPALSQLLTLLTDGLAQILPTLIPALLETASQLLSLIPAVLGLVTALLPLAPALLQIVTGGLEVMAQLLPVITPFIELFVGALTAILSIPGATEFFGLIAVGLTAVWLAATPVAAIFGAINVLLPILGYEALTAGEAVALAMDIALGPVGLVIGAIVLLGVGLMEAWKHSETFRDVVTAAFNAVVGAVGTAIKIMVDLFFMWAEAPLRAFDLVLKALAHLPTWLGGGVASGAEGAVSALIGEIESWRNTTISAINDVINAAKLIPDQFGGDNANVNWGYGDNAAASITQMLKDQGITSKPKAPPALPKFNLPSSGLGSSGKPSAAGASAAKSAATAIKTAQTSVMTDLKALADKTSTQSADSIKKTTDKILGELKGAHLTKLRGAIKDLEKSLLASAKARDALIDPQTGKLTIAKQQLDELTKKAQDFGKAVRDSILSTGDVTKANSASFGGVRNQLRKALADAQEFSTRIAQLQKMHLDPTQLQRIVAAGPEAGLATARAIVSGGQQGVDQLNVLTGQINAIAGKVATDTTNQFFAAGVSAGEGIVKGLESQLGAITKSMDKVADHMVKTVNKKLKSHSPSGVFRDEVMGNVGKGIEAGARLQLVRAERAGNSLSQSIVFGAGAVQVNGVSDPQLAKQSGLLAGSGVARVLQQRRVDAALAAV